MRIAKYQNLSQIDQDSTHIVMPDTNALILGVGIKGDHIQFTKNVKDTVGLKDHHDAVVKMNNHKIEVVDVSENIVPFFFHYTFSDETVLSDYWNIYWFGEKQEKDCNIININKGKIATSIFNKVKVDSTEITSRSLEIRDKPLNYQNWTLVPLVFGLFALAFVITMYNKQLKQIYERVVNFFISTKHSKEKNIHFKRFAIILDLLFIISFSLLVDKAVQKLGFYIPPLKFEYLVFAVISVFLIILRIFRWIIYKMAALFSNLNTFFTDLYANSTLYTRLLSIFLVPTVFIITYTTGFISIYLIYFSLIVTLIVLIIRIIRLFRVFVDSGFSIFYFILYLCALEISPLLIIGKVVLSK